VAEPPSCIRSAGTGHRDQNEWHRQPSRTAHNADEDVGAQESEHWGQWPSRFTVAQVGQRA
jgi:hypothetical protein